MKYEQAFNGEWIQPIPHGYRMRCCDCGVVHTVDFRIKDGRVQIRPTRDNRKTAASRRKPSEKAAMARTQADRDFDLESGREIERKDAEIARLRAALKGIAEYGSGDGAPLGVIDRLHAHTEPAGQS